MAWTRIVRLAALALVVTVAATGAEPTRPLTDLPALGEMPGRWSAVMDLFDVPGMAVAVVRDGTVFAQGFGIRDPQSGAPVTPETLFYIASITKTFTATAICALADEKRLSLDDPVRKYLPRLQLADSSLARTITIRDLLCHRFGIDSQPIVTLDAFTGEITEDRYYHWLAQAECSHSVQYTNVHFTILGRVIEAVTGEPWRDFVARRVTGPADMPRTTGYASAMYSDPNSAVPIERTKGGWRAVSLRKTDRTMHAAGGLGTSALEGARWLRLHLGDGVSDGQRVLSKDSARAMRVTQSRLAKPDGSIRIIEGFGLAWQVGTFNGRRLCQHAGGYEGASAYMAFLPDDGIGVVVLMNAAGAARGLGDIVAVDVLERLTGTKSVFDVYERFTARAREMKQKLAEGPAVPATEPQAVALSQEPKRYAGPFSNPWLGTLFVEPQDESVKLRLGDLQLAISPSTDGSDRFIVEDLVSEKAAGRFVPNAGGAIEAVAFIHPKLGELLFQR